MSERGTIRQELLRRRDAMPAELRQRGSDAIWRRLVELPAFQGAALALFYVSFGSEVDTALMRDLARELGMTVACPRSVPGDKSMRFHVLSQPEEFSAGPYGILQPVAECPLADLKASRAVVLVPGLAFDRRGNRLGFGGGYYDRWLAGEGRGLATVGLAFQGQLLENLPAEAHDVPVDFVVTDAETVDASGGVGA